LREISTASTKAPYFHIKIALAVESFRSNIAFTGGAILQQERTNKELSTRIWKEIQAARKGS